MTSAALERRAAPAPVRVERMTHVPADLAEHFLGVYRAAFAPLEVRAAARQSLTDDEFREEMADARVTKFVAFDADDEAGAMSIVATDLHAVPWISVPYYAHRFPEHFARGAVFYCGAHLVRPDRQGGPWSRVVLDDMFTFVAEHRALLAFDCCGYNVDVIKLPESSGRTATRIGFTETLELDQQRYYAFDMSGGLR